MAVGAGYLAEAVLGGLTVLAKLAPALVAAHLAVAMLVLAGAVALHWRAGHGAGAQLPVTRREVHLLARLLLFVLAFVIVLGTVATGAGPDAGSPDAPRFGFRFQAVAELHAVVVRFLAGLIVAAFFALRLSAVPPAAHRAYAMLLAVTVLQAAVGYSQYFAGLPADPIEIHMWAPGSW